MFFSLFPSLNLILLLNAFCGHIRPPLSASSLRPLTSSIAMIVFFLVLGQLWPKPSPLLLVVLLFGIVSLPSSLLSSLSVSLFISLVVNQERDKGQRELGFVNC